ncbi:MAG: response regulator [Bacteroidales bacterium]|nr:response regulator [Bacteroidales bacterium]
MKLPEILEGKRILVADDDTVSHLLIQDILMDYNVELFFVSNGLEAVRHVSNNPVDIVLMDIRMPIMNGFEASGRIKSTNPGVKILIQTAFPKEYQHDALFKGMIDGILAKPIRKKRLIEELVNLYEPNKNFIEEQSGSVFARFFTGLF